METTIEPAVSPTLPSLVTNSASMPPRASSAWKPLPESFGLAASAASALVEREPISFIDADRVEDEIHRAEGHCNQLDGHVEVEPRQRVQISHVARLRQEADGAQQ